MHTPSRPREGPPDPSRVRRFVILAAVVAIAFGVLIVEGYVFDVGPLVVLTPFLPPTQPLVAVMFLCAGLSLLSLRVGLVRFQRIPALLTTLLAAVILGEYALGLDLGLDRLLFPQDVATLSRLFPGRPAPIAAATFLLVGVALLIAGFGPSRRPRRWFTAIILGAVILPVIPIVGLLLDVPELYSLTRTIGTSLHTALAMLLLALGVAAATQEAWLLRLLRDRDTGTILLRRLLPLAVLLPLLFAAGSVVALHYGLYAVHVGLVLYVSWCIGMFLAVAFWMAAVVHRADAERRAAVEAQAELAVRNALLKAETESAATAQESERRTRELLDILSHAPVFARGFDGHIRFWSAGAERLYGWSSDEATGSLSRELLPTEFAILEREAEADLLHNGEWHGEIVRRSRDGARVQVASRWILHRDAAGNPHTVIEIDNDVTHQKRAEEALREGEARYRALIAATTQIIWTASPGGKRPLDLTQWEAFTGQSALEADWDGWIQAIHPDDQAEAIRLWNDAVCNRKALLTEHRLRRRDGEYRHMEARAVPVFDETGAVREWIWAHADITDRVMAQERLGQAQKLQAVGTLAGGVAHEVNNQLMAVLGFGDFVLKELGPGHAQTGDVEEMIRGATRAAKVAQQLLTFSRRQVNQSGLLDIHAAVEALRPVLKQLLGADKTLEILPSRTRRKVLADATQIDQVLINLAANARDAMGTGGRLSILIDEVVLDESYARSHTVGRLIPGPYVRLIVSDTGSGMDRETMAKIFEPFFTTKPVGAGTGLGLSTVYGIVKQHDGFIWAYSELGLGTTMKLYIPAAMGEHARPAEKREEPRHEPAGRLAPALILVVEDEPSVRNLVRRTLEGAGLTVIEAENGRHALETVATLKEPPDLVLTDVIMAGLNGRELSEALAMIQPGLPVLFMSGYTGDEVLARSLLPAKAPFIQKPFVPEELVARVRLLLASAQASPASPAPRSDRTGTAGTVVIGPPRGPSSSTTH
jgi:PAS domain S-box-containing protein